MQEATPDDQASDHSDEDFFVKKHDNSTAITQLDEYLTSSSTETMTSQHGHLSSSSSSKQTLPCQLALHASSWAYLHPNEGSEVEQGLCSVNSQWQQTMRTSPKAVQNEPVSLGVTLTKGAVRDNLPPVARALALHEFKMASHVKTRTMNRRVTLDAVNVLRTSEVPIPEPPPEGAIVKVMFAGVCHTDVRTVGRLYHAKFVFPRVLGHEISGTIYRLGDEVVKARPDVKIGDRVSVYPWGKCQQCANCLSDIPLCTTLHYGRGPMDSYVYGVWRDGGYQNYVVVDFIQFLINIPNNVGMDAAATLMCGGVTSYNAVTSLGESIGRARKASGNALVALIGAGGLALWALQIIKALYPTGVRVLAVDINDEKLQDAKAAGADLTHRWDTSESAEVAADCMIKSCGARPDAIIELTGLTGVIKRALLSLNIGGTITLVGLGEVWMPEMTIDSVIRRNIQIKGVVVGSKRQCVELIDLVQQGKVRPPPMTHIRLEDLDEALDKLDKGTQRGRAVVKM
ncbi:hypothetical protein LSH36_784g01041 [Paralvinella palmiformis]|uniref:Enoyl reductase (ER) domain-containing protein n=1 Tax=Paralvinella palmiformis TaxID=53620 RepID=A0AAD9J171_9ANNE|nr:hypothetical protein LSH36_784g01041 [Paralvinella palmiformis]